MRSERETNEAIEQYGDTVRRLCMLHLKNEADTQDIFQTVFLKYLLHTADFESREHEKAWFIVTARNECKNQLKHWWRTSRAGEEALEHLAWEQPEDRELWEYILSLPEKYRMVLYLHYYQGYSTLETAEILGKNPSTVRTWLVQARWKLKDILEVNEYGRP